MPFGTEITAEGVLFRLWAPGAEKIDLDLEEGDDGSNLYPMADENGWYRLLAVQAAAGSLYRFRINGGLLAPDPVYRCQAEDMHGPSVVIDPLAFLWQDASWQGRTCNAPPSPAPFTGSSSTRILLSVRQRPSRRPSGKANL